MVWFILLSSWGAKRMLDHFILLFWGDWSHVPVTSGQDIVMKRAGVCSLRNTVLMVDAHHQFLPKFGVSSVNYSLYLPDLACLTFIYSESSISKWKACDLLTFLPLNMRVSTSSKSCQLWTRNRYSKNCYVVQFSKSNRKETNLVKKKHFTDLNWLLSFFEKSCLFWDTPCPNASMLTVNADHKILIRVCTVLHRSSASQNI